MGHSVREVQVQTWKRALSWPKAIPSSSWWQLPLPLCSAGRHSCLTLLSFQPSGCPTYGSLDQDRIRYQFAGIKKYFPPEISISENILEQISWGKTQALKNGEQFIEWLRIYPQCLSGLLGWQAGQTRTHWNGEIKWPCLSKRHWQWRTAAHWEARKERISLTKGGYSKVLEMTGS